MTGPSSQSLVSVRTFGSLFGLGFIGIAALLLTVLVLDPSYADQAKQLGVSLELLAITTGIQSTIMLAVSVLVGLYLAPRLGFRSHVVDRVASETTLVSNVRSELRAAVGGGVAVGVILVLSNWFAPSVGDSTPGMTVELLLQSVPLRLLYGGVTEELLIRWGVMTLVAFALWKLTGQRSDEPGSRVVWTAIVVAAILFGVLHLPAAIPVYGSLTMGIVGFVVGVNALGGIVFGWLFWRQSLEAAIIAHALAHVVAVSIWLVTVLV